jgi:hypothetical protein
MLALSGLDKKPDKVNEAAFFIGLTSCSLIRPSCSLSQVVIKAMDQDSLSRDDTLGSATVALSPKDWDQKDRYCTILTRGVIRCCSPCAIWAFSFEVPGAGSTSPTRKG